jgi:two-component system alkaline phosphatase synthesis response regulator PhoP
MLTARSQTHDKVLSLKLGADDYVTKPFHMQELLARIEALLRRAPSGPRLQAESYQFGPVTVDLRGTSVLRGGQPVNLSAREFQLLRYLISHPGATLTRDELLKEVWGYAERVFTRTVDMHIASLRQKLENNPRQPKFILTMQGLGYKFKP